jgi:hypothetical protein
MLSYFLFLFWERGTEKIRPHEVSDSYNLLVRRGLISNNMLVWGNLIRFLQVNTKRYYDVHTITVPKPHF